MRRLGINHFCALAALAVPFVAQAQETPAPASPSESRLNDIVVTAQKRSENLQDVPIAISVASGEDLVARGIADTSQLGIMAPSLNLRSSAGAFQPSIRGIGTSSTVVENPVALYIDDVYYPQQREGFRGLNNIEQVAILKGPQGTLFGRNATAGVIQLTTLAPSYEFSGKAHAEIDNYATFRSNAYITGGLGDIASGSLSAYYAKQGEGWGESLVTGHDNFKIIRDASVRAKLLIEPSSQTEILLIGDYSDYLRSTFSSQPYGDFPLSVPGTGPLDSVYDSYAGFPSSAGYKGGGGSLKINHDLGFANIVSISAYRHTIGRYQFDNSSVPSPFFIVNSPRSPSEMFSQELQVISNGPGNLDWVVGAYYFHYDNSSDPITRTFSGPFTPSPTSAVRTMTYATETTESIAPFGEVTWEFSPRTELTLGARYTYERRRVSDARIVVLDGLGNTTTTNIAQPSQTSKSFTYRVALSHEFSRDVTAYASFNTGFKSGGFNIVSPATAPYDPEKLRAAEVGVKSEVFDGSVRLNLAAFYYDYTNLQVTQFQGLTQTVVNGPGAELYGLDADFDASLGSGLRLSGGFAILHSEFTDYDGAVFVRPRTDASGNFTGGNIIFPGDATGNRLPLAQEFTGTLAVDYHTEASLGDLDFNITANYNGDYFFGADNFISQDDYILLNASVKWTLPGDGLAISLFGKNLANERVASQVSQQGLGFPTVYDFAPRLYGIAFDMRF